jgi:hypothetical protein
MLVLRRLYVLHFIPQHLLKLLIYLFFFAKLLICLHGPFEEH